MSNKKMITTEDYNSIWEHFSNGFINYYNFNTAERDEKIYSYDFLTVEKLQNKIRVTIENSLWTGGYYLLSAEGTSSPTSEVIGNIIEFSGTGITNVSFVIELSPEITRAQKNIVYKVDYPIYVRPFYKGFTQEVYFKTLTNEPYANLTVVDVDGSNTYTTDANGKVNIPISGGGKAGHHNHLIKVNNDEINLYYRLIKAEYRVGPESTIYRYYADTCTFKLYFNNNQSLSENDFYANNDIYLIINGKRYNIQDHNLNKMYFDLPAFSSETIDIRFVMGGNEYIDAVKYDYTVELPIKEYYFDADIWRDYRKEELPEIIKFNSDSIGGNRLERDLKIIFTEDIIDMSNFIVKNCKLSLENLNIDGIEGKIKLDNGELELKDCSFSHSTDVIIEGTGNVILDNVSFVDNASCININGDLTVKNCLFELADNSYVDITKIPFIKVFGDININNTVFNIDLYSLEELGYSYVAMMINDKNTTNGVANNLLTKNNAFDMKNNTGNISVNGNNYNITANFTWTIQNSNTVFGNNLQVSQED